MIGLGYTPICSSSCLTMAFKMQIDGITAPIFRCKSI